MHGISIHFGLLLVSFLLGAESLSLSSNQASPRGLSFEVITKLAQRRYSSAERENGESPMMGRIAVITGAAGGIGSELSKLVHRLGGTIVVLDRNATGLEALRATLIGADCSMNGKNNNDEDYILKNRIMIVPTNHEDLASVASAANLITNKFDTIDLLINNAGMAYTSDWPSDVPMVAAHGKDLSFTVNYLSHFLLTEKLAGHLSDCGRIVHITSTFHWKVDGSELLPSNVDGIPCAYQSDSERQHPNHIGRSYANTKLAQIWHSRSLSPILPKGCSSVCACPLWAAAGIAGESSRDFLSEYAFSIEDCGPGLTSAINAMLRTDDELGDALNDGTSFVANANIVQYDITSALMASDLTKRLGWRDTLGDLAAAFLLLAQKYAHEEFTIQRTSPESQNRQDRDAFYDWSKREVEPWL